MLRLIRHRLWPLACVAALMPYALAAVFADFGHVHSAQEPRAPVGAVYPTVEARPLTRPPVDGTDPSCPACAWLRTGHRAETPVTIGLAARELASPIRLLESEWPDSPVPHQPALRGPPPPSFS
jgi:hypothetical protein